MMNWLLKFDGYPPSVLFALLLHGLLLYVLLPHDMDPAQFVKVERPPAVAATMSKENPQRLRRLDQLQQQQRAADAAERARQQAREREQAEARRVQAEEQARQKADAERRQLADAQAQQQRQKEQADAEARKQEQERQAAARAEAERQERLRQEQLAAAEQQRQAEARLQAERQAAAQAESLSAETDLVAQYSAIIRQTISGYWSLPPGARNGMTVVIQLQLLPTGEVLDSRILQSSGHDAYDRSALQAVAKVGRFVELRDLDPKVFDRNFRNFTLLFRPEDLLR